jgi:hypothetical protein
MRQDDDERPATLAIVATAQNTDRRRLLEVIADVACQLSSTFIDRLRRR